LCSGCCTCHVWMVTSCPTTSTPERMVNLPVQQFAIAMRAVLPLQLIYQVAPPPWQPLHPICCCIMLHLGRGTWVTCSHASSRGLAAPGCSTTVWCHQQHRSTFLPGRVTVRCPLAPIKFTHTFVTTSKFCWSVKEGAGGAVLVPGLNCCFGTRNLAGKV
jgi:hypothetical protein